MSIAKQLEALLVASGKPYKPAHLVKVLSTTPEELDRALGEVADHLNQASSGLKLFQSETEVAIVTDPEVSDFIAEVLQKDLTGELTKPSLETLTIIAYRGPVTKPEIEQIRGVNCSLILRNLMIRGLLDEQKNKQGLPVYSVSMAFLQYLGVKSVSALPSYKDLNTHAVLESLKAS